MMSTFLFSVLVCAIEVNHPVYPPEYTLAQVDTLKESVAPAMALPVEALYDLVPEQSGIFYCGCPNCDGGTWERAGMASGMGDRSNAGTAEWCSPTSSTRPTGRRS